jgi:hypothetical protein
MTLPDADNDSNSNINTYNQTVKINRCVVCGHDQGNMRGTILLSHTVSPQFQNPFTARHCLLVCYFYHVKAGKNYHKRMQRTDDALRTDPETAPPELIDKRVQVRSIATALLKWKHHLPVDRIAEYESLLCEWYELPQPQPQQTVTGTANDVDDDTATATTTSITTAGSPTLTTTAQLQLASELESHRPNPKYISGPTLVMEFFGFLFKYLFGSISLATQESQK